MDDQPVQLTTGQEHLGDLSIWRSLSEMSTVVVVVVGCLEKERAAGIEAVSRLELLLDHMGPGFKAVKISRNIADNNAGNIAGNITSKNDDSAVKILLATL